MHLFVWNYNRTVKIPVEVTPATKSDLQNTSSWQTKWTSKAVASMPNKVSLHRVDDGELLGMMSYDIHERGMAVEVIYIESAGHSNANLLRSTDNQKKYLGIAHALFAYAAQVSMDAGFGGVFFFRAKTTKLKSYYMKEFGAVPLGQYDPLRLIVWEEAAETLLSTYEVVSDDD